VNEGGGDKVTDADWEKLLMIDGSMSWTVFRRQFEAVTEHKNWASCRPAGLIEVLVGRYGDHHLSGEYQSQMKARTHLIGKLLEGSSAAI
jgi:hypothetical protein